MRLVVVGVNHKTAPVAMRERLAFGNDQKVALTDLIGLTAGAVIVSTCNRSEIYAYVDTTDDEWQDEDDDQRLCYNYPLAKWLAQFKALPIDEIAPYLYVYEGNRALTHWLRVAVGLDSMILGEPQILGQIKQAVAVSYDAGSISPAFGSLIQKIFKAARIVRRDTALGRQAVTLGFATAKLVTQIFDNPAKTTLLLVAAGEMNRLVAHNVASLGMERIIICNRSPKRAQALADELSQMAKNAGRVVEIELAGLDELGDKLAYADVVSSCSGSMNALIDKAMTKQAMKIRKHRAMLMVDLAVPRDIEPVVGQIDGVYLYSIDDLQHVIAGNIEERKQAAVEAELLVGQLASGIESDMQVQAMGQTIAKFRAIAEQKKTNLLDEALLALSRGDDPKTVLTTFAHRLTSTLTHPPSKLLRSSATYLDDEVLEKISQEILTAYRH